MIHGVGTDLAEVARFALALTRHGERFAARILAADEIAAFRSAGDPARFLAKRFAAKEAFGKALGTGVRAPATLHAVRVGHDALGKPALAYADELASYLRQRRLLAHLSLSDEAAYALAFVVIESVGEPHA